MRNGQPRATRKGVPALVVPHQQTENPNIVLVLRRPTTKLYGENARSLEIVMDFNI